MELNYKEFGQGDPIIILHGMFGTLDNWQTIAKQLAETNTVYIIDQRNHGRSPHTDEMDYVLMAEDLKNFMEANWIYSAIIIGHSMGGKTAMQFALEYPDMVEKLIVVDIAPKAYEGGHALIFEALFSVDINALESRKEADVILQEKIPDFGVRQFLLKNLSRNKKGGYQWKMNLNAIYNAYSTILGNVSGDIPVDVPTLFIRGGKSDYILDTDEALLKEYFSDSTLSTVENAGHWVHAETPKELLNLVKNFVS